MYGYRPLTVFLQDWCARNLPSGSPGRPALHTAWRRHFEAKLAEQEIPHGNAGLFGMSSAAGCLRANALKRAGIKGAPTPGDDLVTFEIGHALESLALAILEASGFELAGTQIPAVIDGVMSSAADSALLSGPVDLPYPCLVSAKTSSYKATQRGKRRGFAALPLDGVAEAHPSWHLQAQLEMRALPQYGHVLVLVLAKDMVKVYEGDPLLPSLSWYAEVLPRRAGFEEPTLIAHRHVLAAEDDAMQSSGVDEADVARSVMPITWWPRGGSLEPIVLPEPGIVNPDKGKRWSGPNAEATGRFNPCGGCDFPAVCRGEA
jgi:hypothetical protein